MVPLLFFWTSSLCLSPLVHSRFLKSTQSLSLAFPFLVLVHFHILHTLKVFKSSLDVGPILFISSHHYPLILWFIGLGGSFGLFFFLCFLERVFIRWECWKCDSDSLWYCHMAVAQVQVASLCCASLLLFHWYCPQP